MITSEANRWGHTGDGSTTAFAYENLISAKSDLKVYVAGVLKTLTTDYDVSGVGLAAGGNVTFVAAPATSAAIVIVADTPATQGAGFDRNGPFPSEAAAAGLDKLARLVQQLQDRIGGVIRTPLYETLADELPDAATRAAGVVGFDAAGALEVRAGNGIGSLAAVKNKIMNGDFRIWQRGTSIASAPGYAADRWRWDDGVGLCSFSRQAFTLGQTDVPGEPAYKARYNVVSAGAGDCLIEQRIEDVRTLAGATVTLSFWAKVAADTLSVTPRLRQHFGTTGSPSSDVDADGSAITVTTTWTQFTVTKTLASISGKTLGTDGNDYLAAILILPSSTDFQLEIANVQLEAGGVATAFEQRPLALELAMCQRYFEAIDYERSSGAQVAVPAFMRDSTHASGLWAFQVRKRALPSIAYDGSASDYEVSHNNTTTDASAVSVLGSQSLDAVDLYWTVASGLTAGQGGILRLKNSSARIKADAEL